MHVVATAGHVDHGKSTLVRALTGMEPDRWAEERRRGMTIDLGFAWTTLPSSQQVAFVDVPGHQRFLGNMLAGVGPAPAVLFVVAADEGWRRQSAEHLAAVDALDVRHGVLAVTRSDLADPEPATAQALGELARSSLGLVPHVVVSGTTGAGLDRLRAALDDLVLGLPEPDQDAPVRLWVDRSFSIRGAGTVVTGTLTAGALRTGDELDLDGRRVRVRGLQSLGTSTDEVTPVARVAVNLRDVTTDDVGRGAALLTQGAWRRTSVVDVRLDVEVREELVLHVGSAAVPARVRALGNPAARLARVQLSRSLPLRAGDRGLLRDPAAQMVASGFVVLDADPPALRRRGAALARAADLAAATGAPDLLTEVTRRGFAADAALRALGLEPRATDGLRERSGWWVTDEQWQQWVEQLRAAAAVESLEPGVADDAARQVLGLPEPSLLSELVRDAGLERSGGRVRRPGARPDLGAAEEALREVERRLAARPYDPPDVEELATLRLGHRELAAAEAAGRLLRITREVVVLPTTPALAMRVLAALPQPFTLSAAREALGTTRRVAVPLLELLDERGWTERVDGQLRRVVR